MTSASPFGTPGAVVSTFEYDLPPEGEDSKFYVQPGAYIARIVDFESKQSKGGNPMWVLKFKVLGEAVAPGEKPKGVDCADKELSLFLVTTKTAAWRIRPVAAALGVLQGDKVKFTHADLIGKGAIITVIDNEYDGKKGSSIDLVKPLPPGVTMPKPDDVPF